VMAEAPVRSESGTWNRRRSSQASGFSVLSTGFGSPGDLFSLSYCCFEVGILLQCHHFILEALQFVFFFLFLL
jgi:hypothetical protein